MESSNTVSNLCDFGIDPCPLELPLTNDSPVSEQNLRKLGTSLLSFPPRTIPFRSASFSQVDVTPEGKYVRNSSITLQPTAFCLNSANAGLQSPQSTDFSGIVEENNKSLPTEISEFSPIISHGHSKSCPEKLEPFTSGFDPSSFNEATNEKFPSTELEASRICFTLGGDEEPIKLESIFNTAKENELVGSGTINAKEIGSSVKESLEDSSFNSTETGEIGELTGICNNEKGSLYRQSSCQSDSTSADEPGPLACLSDVSCSSPTPPQGNGGRSSVSTLKLGSSAESSSSDSGGKTSSKSHKVVFNEKDPIFHRGIGRTLSTGANLRGNGRNFGTSSGRYFKRPLRGPYGEMLEAEMNKLVPPRRSTEEAPSFFRDSKSTSPIPKSTSIISHRDRGVSTGNISGSSISNNNIGTCSTQDDIKRTNKEESTSNTNMIGSYIGSMEDLNRLKHSSNVQSIRNRKVPSNLPIQSNYDVGGLLGCHQRTASFPLELCYTTSPNSPDPSQSVTPIRLQNGGSARGHVLAELVETERSYVDALRTLVKKYMEPLNRIIEIDLVEEIFFQVPMLLWHHQRFLDALQKRISDETQSVGDIFLDMFRPNSLLESYALFVRNWPIAKNSLKTALTTNSSLARFLESNAKQHRGKLNLDALLIMPIQRIPRYELLLKELIKYTEPIHEDHSRLLLALEKVKKFALHIDCASIDPTESREIEIEGLGVGYGHLVRQDLLTASMTTTSNSSRKERAIFLFTDSLLVASVKRKNTRKTSSTNHSALGGAWEGCKFKLLSKTCLNDIKILNDDSEQSKVGIEGDDVRTIHRIMDLASSLKCPHLNLDDALKEILANIKSTSAEEDTHVEIQFRNSDSDNLEYMKLFFSSVKKKNGWLDTFNDTMAKFMRYGNTKASQIVFLQALPIRKTRAGLQLSCAAPVSLHSKNRGCDIINDVWVANSDGYVGQICILTLHPDPPSITSCNGVCNSKITCMTTVPPIDQPQQQQQQQQIQQHPPHAFSEPPIPQDGIHSSEDQEVQKQKLGHKERWSVWLGTEDGGLHIYDCADSIRVKKNRHKIQHKVPLNTITYFNDRVFVALGNGDVVVYSRNINGKGWATGDPTWITIGSVIAPVTKMICVGSEIWCATGLTVKVYTSDNSGMLELIHSLQVAGDSENPMKTITSIVAAGNWVWIAIQGSATLFAYHSETFELLHEVNVAPSVTKILSGCDDIIRQHKSACLRVTSLHISPNKMMWIGTSAGVILTLHPANSYDGKLSTLTHGHTGQVRFITCCINRDTWTVISGGDGYDEFRPTSTIGGSGISTPGGPIFYGSSIPSPSSLSSIMTSILGDGGDPSGREDSTNHLLIWKIHKVHQNSSHVTL